MDDDFDFGDLEALTAMMSKFEKPTESAQIVHTPARQPQQELIEIEDEEEEQVAPSVPLGAEANLGAEAAAARAQIRTGHARDFLAGVRAAVQTRTGSTFSPIAGVRMRPLDFEKSSGVTGGGPHSALDAGACRCAFA